VSPVAAPTMDPTMDISQSLTQEIGEASGFMEVVYREMCENQSRALMDLQDRGVTSSEELLKVLSQFPETEFHHYLRAEAPVLRKNGERSTKLREQGNKAYTGRKNSQALELYTQSIRFAPYSGTGQGEELCMAYANRSAVLAQTKQFKLALQDIELSFHAGYPPELAYKLHDRSAKCYQEQGNIAEAVSSLRKAVEAVTEAKVEDDKKEKLREGFRSSLAQLESWKDKTSGVSDSLSDKYPGLPRITNPNPLFPAFSEAVEIRSEVGRGRFGMTTRDVKMGELLCVETPPVFFLHEETSGVNCSHCFMESTAPLPSPTCTQIVFCSRKCQDEAMATYHVVESMFMDILFQHGLKKKEWFLALRTVTSKPLSYILETVNTLGKHDPQHGMKGGKVYSSEDFSSMYHLVSHHDQWNFREHAYKAFFALLFIRCLQKSKYFGEFQSSGLELGPEELVVGCLMVHVMEVATMNAHEIGQMEAVGEESWLVGQTKPVGCALEPTLVLLNHSCDPSLLRVNVGTSTLCFASRDLVKGEEVTDCYSFPFDVAPFEERNQDLSRKYKFSCTCPACSEKWGTFHQLPKSFNDVPMEKMNYTPEELPQLQGKMMKIQKLGSSINALQQKEDFEGASALYSEFCSAIKDVMDPPHQFYVIARRSYGTCLWVKHGNKVRRQ